MGVANRFNRVSSALRSSRIHEGLLYVLGVVYLTLYFFGFSSEEYTVIGLISFFVGLGMRLRLNKFFLRYLKAMVFVIYLINFILLGYGLLIHHFTLPGVSLAIIFIIFSFLFLTLAYFSLRE